MSHAHNIFPANTPADTRNAFCDLSLHGWTLLTLTTTRPGAFRQGSPHTVGDPTLCALVAIAAIRENFPYHVDVAVLYPDNRAAAFRTRVLGHGTPDALMAAVCSPTCCWYTSGTGTHVAAEALTIPASTYEAAMIPNPQPFRFLR